MLEQLENIEGFLSGIGVVVRSLVVTPATGLPRPVTGPLIWRRSIGSDREAVAA